MITSYTRGHQIVFKDNEWFYVDNMQPIKNYERPCKRCGQFSNENGHDACLGNLKDVESACCGHGIHEPILIKKS